MNSTLALAEEMVEGGQWREAIDLLATVVLEQPDVILERKLVDYRLLAPRAMHWPAPGDDWAGNWEEARPREPGIMEIDAADFNARTLAEGILGHGGLIVRGLVDAAETAELRNCIDATIRAREEDDDAADSPWQYASPYVGAKPGRFKTENDAKRAEVKKGSIWVAESPRTMHRLINLYERLGLRTILGEYFAEPPCLSARKWVLRRILPDANEAGWHQDGQFMGTGYNSVNMWLPLSECGEGASAAGMEIIPVPSREILETGGEGAAFTWTVGRPVIEALTRDVPLCHPHFNPGDALFFDHYNLHRTAFGAHLTEPRYAVESWFFSASGAPAKQVPILF